MKLKQAGTGSEVDERLAALMTNANAVRVVAAAVESTIGQKDSILCCWGVLVK
jgi:hypothetical protein